MKKIYTKIDQIDMDVYKSFKGVATVTIIFKDDSTKDLVWEYDGEEHPDKMPRILIAPLIIAVEKIQNRSVYVKIGLKVLKIASIVAGVVVTIALIVIQGRLHVKRS